MLVKASNYSLSSHPSIRLIHHRSATFQVMYLYMAFEYLHEHFYQAVNNI